MLRTIKLQLTALALILGLLLLLPAFNQELRHKEAYLNIASLENSDEIILAVRQEAQRDLFWMFVPTTVTVRSGNASNADSTVLSLVGIHYLRGSDSTGEGRLIALAYPGPVPAQLPEPVFNISDDEKSLDNIGSRALSKKDAPDWVVVLVLSAQWPQWRLRLSVSDGQAVIVTRPGTPVKPPDYVRVRLQDKSQPFSIVDLDTSNVRLPLGKEILSLKAQGKFEAQASLIRMFLQSTSAPPNPTKRLDFSQAPKNATVALFMPYSLLNEVFITTHSQPYPVKWPGAAGSLALKDFKIEPISGGKSFRLSATVADTPGGSLFRLGSDWGGDDLWLEKFSIIQSKCGQLKTADCIGEKAKYNVSAGLINNIHHHKLLRPTTTERFNLQLALNFTRMLLADFIKLQARADGLHAYCNLWIAAN